MKKESQEQKIQRLEKIIREYQDADDEAFLASKYKRELETNCKSLKEEIQRQSEQIQKLNSENLKLMEQVATNKIFYTEKGFQQLEAIVESQKKQIKELQDKNDRNAGRKSKFSLEIKAEIRGLYETGVTMQQLATEYQCSVGLIHKIINEKNEK